MTGRLLTQALIGLSFVLGTGCGTKLRLVVEEKKIQTLSRLSEKQKIQIAAHIPGLFSIREICTASRPGKPEVGYIPGSTILGNEDGLEIKCDQIKIVAPPKSESQLWIDKAGNSVIFPMVGAVGIKAENENLVITTAQYTAKIQSATPYELIATTLPTPTLACLLGDLKIQMQSHVNDVQVYSHACRMNLEGKLYFAQESFFWADRSIPKNFRPLPKMDAELKQFHQLSLDGFTSIYGFLKDKNLHWTLGNQVENCGFFDISGGGPQLEKELSSRAGFAPFPGKYSGYYKCQLRRAPVFSNLIHPG